MSGNTVPMTRLIPARNRHRVHLRRPAQDRRPGAITEQTMTASNTSEDDGQERTDELREKIASMIASRAAPISEDFHTKALAVEARAYDDELESPQEVAEMISEVHKEIEALDEMAQAALVHED